MTSLVYQLLLGLAALALCVGLGLVIVGRLR